MQNAMRTRDPKFFATDPALRLTFLSITCLWESNSATQELYMPRSLTLFNSDEPLENNGTMLAIDIDEVDSEIDVIDSEEPEDFQMIES
jgi:hypothetical protein